MQAAATGGVVGRPGSTEADDLQPREHIRRKTKPLTCQGGGDKGGGKRAAAVNLQKPAFIDPGKP